MIQFAQMSSCFVISRVFFLLVLSLSMLSCNGSRTPDLARNSIPGWSTENLFDSVKEIISADQSFAWRIDTPGGPQTFVWISARAHAIDEKQLRNIAPQTLTNSDDHAVSPFEAPGILLRVDDNGAVVSRSAVFCAPENNDVRCVKSNMGRIALSFMDATRIEGAVFSNSKDATRRYAALFDATVVNQAATPLVSKARWLQDGSQPAAAFMDFMKAAGNKDAAAMRSLSVSKRASEWDHFGLITSMWRFAQKQPMVIAASTQTDSAVLWVLQTSPERFPMLPVEVRMSVVDGVWRFEEMTF